MTLDNSADFDAGQVLTSFAADLTDAAYSVVLRHGIVGSWINLQLDVWRVLAATITESPRSQSRTPVAAEFYAWREMFLSELTDAAYRTALQHGLLQFVRDFCEGSNAICEGCRLPDALRNCAH